MQCRTRAAGWAPCTRPPAPRSAALAGVGAMEVHAALGREKRNGHGPSPGHLPRGPKLGRGRGLWEIAPTPPAPRPAGHPAPRLGGAVLTSELSPAARSAPRSPDARGPCEGSEGSSLLSEPRAQHRVARRGLASGPPAPLGLHGDRMLGRTPPGARHGIGVSQHQPPHHARSPSSLLLGTGRWPGPPQLPPEPHPTPSPQRRSGPRGAASGAGGEWPGQGSCGKGGVCPPPPNNTRA